MTSSDDKKKHASKIVKALGKSYPDAKCALHYENAYQLLVATILAAQCTDERVNKVTPEFFKQYPKPSELTKATQEEVEALVKSTGFYRAKATNLRGMAAAVVADHDGEIPETLEELVKLPGVGRKTASVVLGNVHGIASGVVVDTHVKRISQLMGLTESKNPDRIERDLIQLLPKEEWINFSHRMIDHGRAICIARRPKCVECPILKHCDRVGLPELTE